MLNSIIIMMHCFNNHTWGCGGRKKSSVLDFSPNVALSSCCLFYLYVWSRSSSKTAHVALLFPMDLPRWWDACLDLLRLSVLTFSWSSYKLPLSINASLARPVALRLRWTLNEAHVLTIWLDKCGKSYVAIFHPFLQWPSTPLQLVPIRREWFP